MSCTYGLPKLSIHFILKNKATTTTNNQNYLNEEKKLLHITQCILVLLLICVELLYGKKHE